MKKILFAIAALAALGSLGYVGTWVSAQDGVKTAGATADSKSTLKIGVVNITKVIKDFKKANVIGDKILDDAKKYEEQLKADNDELKKLELKLKTATNELEKEAFTKTFRQKTGELQDKDVSLQKDIRKRRDDMAVEINKDIQRIIDSLAKHLGLEMVLTCPDVPDDKEIGSLSDAMRRMTAPAVWIAWKQPGMDITSEVSRWLNHYCPAPAGSAAAAPTK